MIVFRFRPIETPLFSGRHLSSLLNMRPGRYVVDASLGYGTLRIVVSILEDSIMLGAAEISIDQIKESAKHARRIYTIVGDELVPLSIYEKERLYQLVMFESCRTPTLEISGIHMHRVVVDPLFDDARSKVRILRPRRGSSVLEICTGLGYSTYWLLRRGTNIVASIEKNESVLRLAEYNPWSRHLSRVPIILGDASEVVKKYDDMSFDYIFHDPPRYSVAPELYSYEFYKELLRILRPGGVLFHYVGEPRKKRGTNIIGGVLRRLREAGFSRVIRRANVQCILATKPRS